MKRAVADHLGKVVGQEEAEPVCGQDFCDTCGECLVCSCSFEDPCIDGRGHFWVRYKEKEE